MSIKNQTTKEIQHKVCKILHNLNFRKVKFPKFLDEHKEIKDYEKISFGAVRQEIFQDGEDVINEFDAKTYFIINNIKG